jgi:hypothetical protein
MTLSLSAGVVVPIPTLLATVTVNKPVRGPAKETFDIDPPATVGFDSPVLDIVPPMINPVLLVFPDSVAPTRTGVAFNTFDPVPVVAVAPVPPKATPRVPVVIWVALRLLRPAPLPIKLDPATDPETKAFPTTWRRSDGVVVPTPTILLLIVIPAPSNPV